MSDFYAPYTTKLIWVEQPKRPKGKWNVYEVANTEEEQPIAWECSECGEVVEVQYNFCPNCGSRMRGEEDDD